jgi:hypothetical protein
MDQEKLNKLRQQVRIGGCRLCGALERILHALLSGMRLVDQEERNRSATEMVEDCRRALERGRDGKGNVALFHAALLNQLNGGIWTRK